MRLYLAGPMRGYRDDNREAFDEAATALRVAHPDWVILVPHEFDQRHPNWVLRQKFRSDGGVAVRVRGRRGGAAGLAEVTGHSG